MTKKFLLIYVCTMIAIAVSAQKKVMFDLAHGQFRDTFVDPDYYDYVIPNMKKSLKKLVFSW